MYICRINKFFWCKNKFLFNINSVQVELKQWLYNHGDQCLHNTGGWIKTLNNGDITQKWLWSNGQTWGGSYSANVTFGSSSLSLRANVNAGEVSGYGNYGRPQVNARTSTGIKNNILYLVKYTKCIVIASSAVTIAVRTGSANNSGTFTNTATVIASGQSQVNFNSSVMGTIVLGGNIGVSGVSGQRDHCWGASADFTSDVTQVYMV